MESAQEGTNIPTATIYPAAINTELLNVIAPDRVANVVAFAINQLEDTNVNELTMGPTAQPW